MMTTARQEAEHRARLWTDDVRHNAVTDFIAGVEWALSPTADHLEVVARAISDLEPGDSWPSNEDLGGNLTGTRDDEYRSMRLEEAADILRVMAGQLLANVRPEES